MALVLTLGAAGCASSSSTDYATAAQQRLATDLTAVDDAISAHDPGAARAALMRLEADARSASTSGQITPDREKAILSAVTRLVADETPVVVAAAPSPTPSPHPSPSAKSPASTVTAPKPGKGKGKGKGKGHHG